MDIDSSVRADGGVTKKEAEVVGRAFGYSRCRLESNFLPKSNNTSGKTWIRLKLE
jgi:hypothetical protein